MTSSDDDRFVRVRGAREHNLRNIDVEVPRNALVVFSGVSGSGKSSLAFGTLFAEAQRRFFDSVAPYARRLIEQVGDAGRRCDRRPATGDRTPSAARYAERAVLDRQRHDDIEPVADAVFAGRRLPAPSADAPCRGLFAEHAAGRLSRPATAWGMSYEVTEQAMVPDDSLSIREGAVASWPPAWHGQNLRDILVSLGHDVDQPWRDLPKKVRRWILFTEEQPTVPVYAGFTPAETRAARRRKAEPSYQGRTWARGAMCSTRLRRRRAR